MRKTEIMIIALAALAAFSCQKAESSGRLVFSLEEGEVADIVTKGNVSDYAAIPAAGAFSLTVKDSKLATVYSGTVGGWAPETRLASGSYTCDVTYGSDAEEGPAKPYFQGSAAFTVNGGTTEVPVTVTLGNAIVKIATTTQFNNYYPQSSFTVTTPDNKFTYDGKALFVAYQFTVGGTVTNQAGKSFTLESKTWKGDAATCYKVTYDVNNVGGVSVTVSFNDTVETVNLGEVDLNS